MLNHHDTALAAQELRQFACRHPSGFVVVGGDEGHVLSRVHTGVEDGDRDTDRRCPRQRRVEGIAIGGGDGEAIHVPRDHRVHDLDLAAAIGLGGGAIPLHGDAKVRAGFDGAGLNRLPKRAAAELWQRLSS